LVPRGQHMRLDTSAGGSVSGCPRGE
jgi:hypothetical protein